MNMKVHQTLVWLNLLSFRTKDLAEPTIGIQSAAANHNTLPRHFDTSVPAVPAVTAILRWLRESVWETEKTWSSVFWSHLTSSSWPLLINLLVCGCSARDWERSGLLEEKSPERLFRYLRFSKRATVGVRATYATRWNSGMKRVKCGWTQPLFH